MAIMAGMLARFFSTLICVFVTSGICLAQEKEDNAIVIGKKTSIESKVLGETRPLVIWTPDGYEQGDGKHVTIYLLDPGIHFTHTVGLTKYRMLSRAMPDAIIIGISNTNRSKDMSLAEPGQPGLGGVGKFLQFFEEELVPYVEDNYRVTPYRVLVGHSSGGLVNLQALLHKPDLFSAHISVSPSAWRSDLDEVEEIMQGFDSLNVSFFLTGGNEGGAVTGGIRKLAGVFEEHSPTGFDWHLELMPDEEHMSVAYPGIFLGFKFLFSDYHMVNVVDLYERGGFGEIAKAKARASKRYGIDLPLTTVDAMDIAVSYANRKHFKEVIATLQAAREHLSPMAPTFMELAQGAEIYVSKELALLAFKAGIDVAKDEGNDELAKQFAENVERLGR